MFSSPYRTASSRPFLSLREFPSTKITTSTQSRWFEQRQRLHLFHHRRHRLPSVELSRSNHPVPTSINLWKPSSRLIQKHPHPDSPLSPIRRSNTTTTNISSPTTTDYIPPPPDTVSPNDIFHRIRETDPVDLLRSWSDLHKKNDGSVTKSLNRETIREICSYLGDSPNFLLNATRRRDNDNDDGSDQTLMLMKRFMEWVSENYGFEDLNEFGKKMLKSGNGWMVIELWDWISLSKMKKEDKKEKRLRGISIAENFNPIGYFHFQRERQQRKGYIRPRVGSQFSLPPRPWREELETNDYQACLFFTIVIWSYASLPSPRQPFREILSRLLYQTWVKPLTSTPLSPFRSSHSIQFGLSKIESILTNHCFVINGLEDSHQKNSTILHQRARAREYVSQVVLAQIGWPDLETSIPKTITRLQTTILKEKVDYDVKEWSNLFWTYIRACDRRSEVVWLLGKKIKRNYDLISSPVIVLKEPQFGILPPGGLFPPLISTAIKPFIRDYGLNTKWIQNLINIAIREGLATGHSFWYQALDGAANSTSGDMKSFDQTFEAIPKLAGIEPDAICWALRVTALIRWGRKSEGLELLDRMMSSGQAPVFGQRGREQEGNRLFWSDRNAIFQKYILRAMLDHDLLDEAIDFLEKVSRHPYFQPDSMTYTNLILYLKKHPTTSKSQSQAWDIIQKIESNNVNVNLITLANGLHAAGIERLDELLALMERLNARRIRSTTSSDSEEVQQQRRQQSWSPEEWEEDSMASEIENRHSNQVAPSSSLDRPSHKSSLEPNPYFWYSVFKLMCESDDLSLLQKSRMLLESLPRHQIDGTCWSLVVRRYFECAAERDAAAREQPDRPPGASTTEEVLESRNRSQSQSRQLFNTALTLFRSSPFPFTPAGYIVLTLSVFRNRHNLEIDDAAMEIFETAQRLCPEFFTKHLQYPQDPNQPMKQGPSVFDDPSTLSVKKFNGRNFFGYLQAMFSKHRRQDLAKRMGAMEKNISSESSDHSTSQRRPQRYQSSWR